MASLFLVGTYAPRLCGIANFTADLREAILGAPGPPACSVVAIASPHQDHVYPREVIGVIREQAPEDYVAAARMIDDAGARVVCLQHEFGLFGGPAGDHILAFADALAAPLVVTLHTVLAAPHDLRQAEVVARLAARAAKLVVMSERGRDLLTAGWDVPGRKVAVIPHGGPAPPPATPRDRRAGARLLTFGLLGPDKGVETVIRAMPTIRAAHPDVVYQVIGATHPNLVAHEGERLRESLVDLARALGVAEAVEFQDGHAAKSDLLRAIAEADVCVMPYLKEAHVTSGTLAYAAALGKAVVATPFWHARDLLGDDAGLFAPFGDPDALARAVIELLRDAPGRETMGRRLAERAAGADWSRVGQRYVALFREATPGGFGTGDRFGPSAAAGVGRTEAAVDLSGVLRLTDDVGIMQHSVLSLPARRHGYCLDDNTRALLLMCRLPRPFDAVDARLARTFAAFVEHAWNPDDACVRNFMGWDRRWQEAKGSDDSLGRAVQALCATAVGPSKDLRPWAEDLLRRMTPALEDVRWPRSRAFIVLGLAELHAAGAASDDLARILERHAASLAAEAQDADGDWPWFEDSLSYDNARLPEALIRAGVALGDTCCLALGLETLAWLCARQTAPEGHFRPVATEDFGRPRRLDGVFDQQPLEAAATIDACLAAFEATGRLGWAREADRALAWYGGANDLGASLLPEAPGECRDGLRATGVNANQGAESVIGLQLALCARRRIRALSAKSVFAAAGA